MTYNPGSPPSNADEFRSWTANELEAIADEFSLQDFVQLKELHAVPAKLRTGLIVLADGTDWDPGSGAGVYAYYGAAWHKLG